MTPDQRAMLSRLANETRDLAESLLAARREAPPSGKAPFRYPHVHVERAVTELTRAVAYDERHRA